MPIVTIDTITRPEHLIEFLADYLRKSDEFEFEYIAKYDERLIPKYPAAHLQVAGFDKRIHGTHTMLLGMRAAIHVLHANMQQTRATRNYEDLVLATKVVEYLEEDMTLGDRVIHGFVESETPGIMPPRVTKGDAITVTRLSWFGIQETRF